MKSVNKHKKKINKKILMLLGIPWCLLFLVFTYAYCGYTTSLTVDSTTAVVEAHILDYVFLTSVNVSDSGNGGSAMARSFGTHSTWMSVNLPNCNSYVTYELSIVNTTKYIANITEAEVLSTMLGSGADTSDFKVEFLDCTPGVTYIDPYQTKTIHVKLSKKVTNGLCTSQSNLIATTEFDYSLYKYSNLTVVALDSVTNNPIPNATVTIKYGQGANDKVSGTGSVTKSLDEGAQITYFASAKHYTASGESSYTKTFGDNTIYVKLTPVPSHTLTVEVNKSDASIICAAAEQGSSTYETLASGNPDINTAHNRDDSTWYNFTATIYEGETIACSVGYEDPVYYSAVPSNPNDGWNYTCSNYISILNGPYDCGCYFSNMSASSDISQSCLLKSKLSHPSAANNNSARNQAITETYTARDTGYYMIQLWGGQGGDGYNISRSLGGPGGNRGYVYGLVYLEKGHTITYTLGGSGSKGSQSDNAISPIAANGGATNDKSRSWNAGSSGGYSAVYDGPLGSTLLMLAGGGGAGGGPGGSAGGKEAGGGGDGGILGQRARAVTGGTVYDGASGSGGKSSDYNGAGGTNVGGAHGTYAKDAIGSARETQYSQADYNDAGQPTTGSSLQGGYGRFHGGPGGGGYFGGGGGTQSKGNGNNCGGGGGGSSYIKSTVVIPNAAPSGVNPGEEGKDCGSVHCGGGIRITYYGASI